MSRSQPLDRDVAAAARALRPRWLVCDPETGVILATALILKPRAPKGYVVVAAQVRR